MVPVTWQLQRAGYAWRDPEALAAHLNAVGLYAPELDTLIDALLPRLSEEEAEVKRMETKISMLPDKERPHARKEVKLRSAQAFTRLVRWLLQVALGCVAARPRRRDGCVATCDLPLYARHRASPVFKALKIDGVSLFGHPVFIKFALVVATLEVGEQSELGTPKTRRQAEASAAATVARLKPELAQLKAGTVAALVYNGLEVPPPSPDYSRQMTFGRSADGAFFYDGTSRVVPAANAASCGAGTGTSSEAAQMQQLPSASSLTFPASGQPVLADASTLGSAIASILMRVVASRSERQAFARECQQHAASAAVGVGGDLVHSALSAAAAALMEVDGSPGAFVDRARGAAPKRKRQEDSLVAGQVAIRSLQQFPAFGGATGLWQYYVTTLRPLEIGGNSWRASNGHTTDLWSKYNFFFREVARNWDSGAASAVAAADARFRVAGSWTKLETALRLEQPKGTERDRLNQQLKGLNVGS